jgi:hypothetical protein
VSLYQAPDGLYRSTLLESFGWLDHAFGTAAAAPPPGYLLLKQVHSATVLHSSEWLPDAEADALVASGPGVRLAVKTADCVPVLICDPRRRAVAAVHAGWRGAHLGVAAAAIARMMDLFSSVPEELYAALGPSIGPCCYEVGPDVASLFPPAATAAGRPAADLRGANVSILNAVGLPLAHIDANPPCTYCGGAEFFSWRRDRAKGQRMIAVIGLR